MMNLERETVSAAHWSQQHYGGLFLPGADRQGSERYAWVVEADRELHPKENLETQTRLRGFLIAHRMNDVYELENLVVSTEMRRKGIATLLVTQLLAQSRETRASSIFLEVRESNQSARKLYEKFGFVNSGFTEKLLSGPQEDAVLYRLNLC